MNLCASMTIVSVMNLAATRCSHGDVAPSYVQAILVFVEAMRERTGEFPQLALTSFTHPPASSQRSRLLKLAKHVRENASPALLLLVPLQMPDSLSSSRRWACTALAAIGKASRRPGRDAARHMPSRRRRGGR